MGPGVKPGAWAHSAETRCVCGLHPDLHVVLPLPRWSAAQGDPAQVRWGRPRPGFTEHPLVRGVSREGGQPFAAQRKGGPTARSAVDSLVYPPTLRARGAPVLHLDGSVSGALRVALSLALRLCVQLLPSSEDLPPLPTNTLTHLFFPPVLLPPSRAPGGRQQAQGRCPAAGSMGPTARPARLAGLGPSGSLYLPDSADSLVFQDKWPRRMPQPTPGMRRNNQLLISKEQEPLQPGNLN